MTPALNALDHKALIAFFAEIGVEAHFPDGFRVFPKTHSSQTIITALEDEMKRLDVSVECSQKVEELLFNGEHVTGRDMNYGSLEEQIKATAAGGE